MVIPEGSHGSFLANWQKTSQAMVREPAAARSLPGGKKQWIIVESMGYIPLINSESLGYVLWNHSGITVEYRLIWLDIGYIYIITSGWCHKRSGITYIYIYIWLVVSNICFIFHFIYGMSSIPLTNSYFSRWFFNHQPDIIGCDQRNYGGEKMWTFFHGFEVVPSYVSLATMS